MENQPRSGGKFFLWITKLNNRFLSIFPRGSIPGGPLVIALACVIGLAGGFGASLFTEMIHFITSWCIEPFLSSNGSAWYLRVGLAMVPALGLVAVAWFTRRFAPEAQGHGVPEVITAVARKDGIIRPRVSLVKILASAFSIGTGGSVGREGPIVQIGSSLGSAAGQWFRFSAEKIKTLVACGAAAGISATFNAPLAGVVFASEIILGSFAVRNITPIVISSVLANVVQVHYGEHRLAPAFRELNYQYLGSMAELPLYFVLGLLSGVAAVSFTKMLYGIEDLSQRRLSKWWARAVVAGLIVGAIGVIYPGSPPTLSQTEITDRNVKGPPPPPVFGVGYHVIDHTLHLENQDKPSAPARAHEGPPHGKALPLDRGQMLGQFWWLLPLVFLKPLLTSITLAGGGSGGIFAPSLFLGATLGACFGLLVNLLLPGMSGHPGIYAVVGMGAVVAGTTHGPLSAILIVYEMTNDYRIMLPIMIAAGLASMMAAWIDPESIYEKKLSRRGEWITRGHHVVELEHVKVGQMMIRDSMVIRPQASLSDILSFAREKIDSGSLPVVDDEGHFHGFIRKEDLHQWLQSEVDPELVIAEDIALHCPLAISTEKNLLEALADFGSRDLDTLPVEVVRGKDRQFVGILRRSDVMKRYHRELLRRRASH